MAALEAEIGNLWAALAFGLEAGDGDLVRSIVAALPMYWIMRGRLGEARSWLDRALDLDPTEDDLRRRLLSATATIAALHGDHVVAVEAADEAARIATELGGATDRMEGLRERALAALLKNDFATAEPLYEELLGLAIEVDNGVRTSACRLNLATIANHTDRIDRAEGLLRENLSFVRARGQSRCEATTLALLAETALRRDEVGAAAEPARAAALRSSQIGDDPLLIYSLELVAASADGDARRAAMLLGATTSARARMELEPDDDEALVRGWAEARLADALPPDDLADAVSAGRGLDLSSALASVTERLAGDDPPGPDHGPDVVEGREVLQGARGERDQVGGRVGLEGARIIVSSTSSGSRPASRIRSASRVWMPGGMSPLPRSVP